MMTSIVEEKLISFKELEKKVFKFVCELGCEIIRFQLEQYDAELAADRDKSTLRNKGLKRTTIKTLCGEVEYRRRVYQTGEFTRRRPRKVLQPLFIYWMKQCIWKRSV